MSTTIHELMTERDILLIRISEIESQLQMCHNVNFRNGDACMLNPSFAPHNLSKSNFFEEQHRVNITAFNCSRMLPGWADRKF